jgi:hypothetical protein
MGHREIQLTGGSGQQDDAGTGRYGDAEKKDSRDRKSEDRGQNEDFKL